MASVKTLHEAFVHELSDTYNAEHQLTEAMQGMLELAQHAKVKAGLQQHLRDTKQQIKNLDQVFQSLQEKPQDVTCKGVAGIISEFKSGAKEIKEPPLLDGFIVAGGLKGEHYEIATYRYLVGKAQLMGRSQAAELLQENLRMEEDFAQQLEQVDQLLGQELVGNHPELIGPTGSGQKSGGNSR